MILCVQDADTSFNKRMENYGIFVFSVSYMRTIFANHSTISRFWKRSFGATHIAMTYRNAEAQTYVNYAEFYPVLLLMRQQKGLLQRPE